jgi:hypothetical protein
MNQQFALEYGNQLQRNQLRMLFLDVFELFGRTIELGPPKSINIIHRIFQKENKI